MISLRTKMKLINWWPPILGTGISIKHVDEDMLKFVVELKLRWYNKNWVGIHFGGSLYTMCDPWYMFILMFGLGKEYMVMDKGAGIKYLMKSKSTVSCTFQVNKDKIEEIKSELDLVGKKDYAFLCEIKNMEGELVAQVEKIIYVRKKSFDWEKQTKTPT